MKWYEFTPVDTIFFRGSEPMMMGESHTSSANFPPPLMTLTGAVRTTVLKENNISISDYYSGNADNKILENVGKAGDEAGFCLTGPLFKVKRDSTDEILIPVPFTYYTGKKKLKDLKKDGKIKIIKSKLAISKLITTDSDLQWVVNSNSEDELVSLGGNWMPLSDLGKDEITLYKLSCLKSDEQRVGIALNTNYRGVREGHIYSFTHVRLHKDVSIVFGIDKDILNHSGVMSLGAEKRFGMYNEITEPKIPSSTSTNFINLSLLQGSEERNKAVISSGKPVYLGGWDLKKGFHKPMTGYYPVGSVFNTKITDNCIAI